MQSGKRTRLSSASSIDPAIHDAVENFVAAASRQLSPADFPSRGRGDDFLEPRIAAQRIPGRIEAKFAVAGTSWNFRDDFELLNREGGSPSGCMQRGFDSLHPL